MNHSNHGRRLLSAAAVVLGNAGYSLTVALFLEPAGLVAGGATGVALAFGRLTGLSVSGFLLAFNLVMLVWGWVVLGRAFALNTLASSILSPIFLGLAETMLHGRVLTEDLFLNTVFAAIGVGAFMGIVIRAGASTGGMDIPPLVLTLPSSSSRSRSARCRSCCTASWPSSFRSWSWTKSCSGVRAVPRSS